MPNSGEIKKWIVRVSGTVAGTIILLGIGAQWTHYARSSETEARSVENEKSLAPIKELVKQLGERATVADAAYEERAKLCRQGIITDVPICRAVDEVVVE